MQSPADHPETQASRTVLTFILDSDRYCVPTERVSSVLGIADPGVVDEADDPWYAGEISTGGERIRVVDLPRVFAPPTATVDRPSEPKLLVFDRTDDEGRYVGWLVDDVGRTRDVDPATITGTGAGLSFVTGRCTLEGDSHRWLDERAIHDR